MASAQGLVTVGLGSHRVEVLPFLREQMERHETIVLEEPPVPSFQTMLRGHLSVDDHLLEVDSEFPQFDRLMCAMLKELHGTGRHILQQEPYLEGLIEIHELFAEGKLPEDVMNSPRLRDIYAVERKATGALIFYYASSAKDPFPKVVEAVKKFARADAIRLLLRDRLRAHAIASATASTQSIFVEAGYIHYPLTQYLRSQLGSSSKIRVVFLLEPVIRRLGGKRRNLGPGDVLTLLYMLHRQPSRSLTNLLAARSLITIKLIRKEELLPGATAAPHVEDEIRINNMVDRFGFEDCEKLFNTIRFLNGDLSLRVAEEYSSSRIGNH
jgi:hypothetical protein